MAGGVEVPTIRVDAMCLHLGCEDDKSCMTFAMAVPGKGHTDVEGACAEGGGLRHHHGEEAPVRDHRASGSAKDMVKTIQGLLRILKGALETRLRRASPDVMSPRHDGPRILGLWLAIVVCFDLLSAVGASSSTGVGSSSSSPVAVELPPEATS